MKATTAMEAHRKQIKKELETLREIKEKELKDKKLIKK